MDASLDAPHENRAAWWSSRVKRKMFRHSGMVNETARSDRDVGSDVACAASISSYMRAISGAECRYTPARARSAAAAAQGSAAAVVLREGGQELVGGGGIVEEARAVGVGACFVARNVDPRHDAGGLSGDPHTRECGVPAVVTDAVAPCERRPIGTTGTVRPGRRGGQHRHRHATGTDALERGRVGEGGPGQRPSRAFQLSEPPTESPPAPMPPLPRPRVSAAYQPIGSRARISTRCASASAGRPSASSVRDR